MFLFVIITNDHKSMKQMLISVIIPIFNEEKNIGLLYQELRTIIDSLPQFSFEIIFVNDGSKDNSWLLIEQLIKQDPIIRAIKFSRNFGHQAALSAGYNNAKGGAIITMDADLQDPPELIPLMLNKWEYGAKIVYARRADRKDSFLKRISAIWYYKLLDSISDVTMPRNVGDFRLIDKQVLLHIKEFPEKFPYLRGTVAWLGFSYDFVDFKRPNRMHGTTGYTWSKMIQLAFNGVTNFSLFPLKLSAFIGIFVIITGLAMFTYITVDALFFKVHYPLFKWLVTTIYIFMGIQFLLMWIIGEYIGRIFEQQKNRPLYVIEKKLNCTE